MATIFDWSVIAANNDTADADINWKEGQFPDTVNNSARQMMARIAEWIKDQGVLTAGGSATAISLSTTNTSITVPIGGMTFAFRAAVTNTGATTLALNGGGSRPLRKVFVGDSAARALEAGDIVAQGIYLVHYDANANAGAGAWILINPTNLAQMQHLIDSSLNNAPIKTTPSDADGVVITDSADSGKTKRVLWSRTKTTLKAHFDSLYANISHTHAIGAITGTENWLRDQLTSGGTYDPGHLTSSDARFSYGVFSGSSLLRYSWGDLTSALEGNFVKRSGDTVPWLRISNNPSNVQDATRKGYVDDQVATRAPSSHTHTIAQVSGLQGALNGKANSSHTHTSSQITNFNSAADARVMNRLTSMRNNWIGTCVLAYTTYNNDDWGATIPGSALYPAGFDATTLGTPVIVKRGAALSGTWCLMGYNVLGSGNKQGLSLYYKIAD